MTSPSPNDNDTPPATPRWVKVFGMIVLVVLILFVVLKFAGGGRHGPGRHMQPRDTTGQAQRGHP